MNMILYLEAQSPFKSFATFDWRETPVSRQALYPSLGGAGSPIIG